MDINTEVGMVHDMRLGELRLYTDYGRCCRPLFIVEKQQLRITKNDIRRLIESQQGLLEENEDEETAEAQTFGWSNLIQNGLIEYFSSTFFQTWFDKLSDHINSCIADTQRNVSKIYLQFCL